MDVAERDGSELSSRDKVLRAAMQMFGEDPGTNLTVRAVASRAGVSMGSLRYHFPTQRELQDEVLTRLYDLVFPDERIHDSSVPARDRLIDCMRQLLSPVGTGARARKTQRTALKALLVPEPTEETRTAYVAVEREIRRRVEHWLIILAKEGALPEGDTMRRVKFLITVVNGLGLERAVPSEDSILHSETETLYTAVDAVLGVVHPDEVSPPW